MQAARALTHNIYSYITEKMYKRVPIDTTGSVDGVKNRADRQHGRTVVPYSAISTVRKTRVAQTENCNVSRVVTAHCACAVLGMLLISRKSTVCII